MKKLIGSLFAALALVSGAANATLITSVNKTTNDGVYTLSAAQADMLGVSGADRLAFVRLRDNGIDWNIGDYFDISTILNSTNDDSKIMGIFNGVNASLDYIGGDFDTFISATIVNDLSGYYEGVAFAFNSASGNIVFKGTTTFNGGQTRGDAEFLPVPEPTTLATMALGLLAFAMRRRAK